MDKENKNQSLKIVLLIVLMLILSMNFIDASIDDEVYETLINNTGEFYLDNAEEDCQMVGASWEYISPENEESRYECVCSEYIDGKQTMEWNGTNCFPITSESKCKNTGGVLVNRECMCEDGEWIEDIGCQTIEHKSNLLNIFLIIFGSLIILFLILIIFGRNRKK